MSEPLSFVARDVYEYLVNLKRYGHRGQTSREIVLKFYGITSEPGVLKQLARLKKGKYVREVKLRYKKHEVIFYEAI
jgi:hypothetical protein